MLIVVRHGRTEANASGLLLGRLDPALDEVGLEQAAALGRTIAADATAPVRIVTSPLGRTRETAAAISAATGAPVDADEQWIELDYGEYDGRPQTDVPAEVWRAWRQDLTYAPPGGESLLALGARVRAALDALADEARAADVVVVSHVSPIKAAVTWALGVGDEVVWRTYLAPASITRIAIAPHGPVLHSFNEVAHLS